MKIRDLGEFGLIRRLTQQRETANKMVIQSVGDDAAVFDPPADRHLLLTCDMLVENRHFLIEHTSAFQLGRKALAVSLSDIAAMGGWPECFLVSLGLPPHIDVAFCDELYRGFYEEAEQWQASLVGGDTVSSPQYLVIDIMVVGSVPKGEALYRHQARAGDRLWVSGWPGLSAAGLQWLLSGASPESFPSAVAAHRTPCPRIIAAGELRKTRVVHSMDDVSDGVGNEALEIAAASKVDIIIHEAELPCHVEVEQVAKQLQLDPVQLMLFGGEDYELLFTATNSARMSQIGEEIKRKTGLPLTPIGKVSNGTGNVFLQKVDGELVPLSPGGFKHF